MISGLDLPLGSPVHVHVPGTKFFSDDMSAEGKCTVHEHVAAIDSERRLAERRVNDGECVECGGQHPPCAFVGYGGAFSSALAL